jgi:hypothetical protein
LSALRKLESDFDAAIRQVKQARNRAIRETAYEVKRHLQWFSSGPISSAQLAREDHPYATRHMVSRYDPAIINKQTGVFRQSWQIGITNIAGHPIYVVRNTASYAEYLEHGTRKMIARPIDVEARKFAAELLAHKLELYVYPAIASALSG